MGRRVGGSAAAPHGAACSRRPQPCGALRRALALLLLATLAAPVSHAALTATSATIRAVAADVGAHTFSASLRATFNASTPVGRVQWMAWDTAACGGTASIADVQAKRDCNGTVLAGAVNLVRPQPAWASATRAALRALPALTRVARQNTLWNPVEVRVGPGLLSQTNYTLFLTDGVSLIGLSVVTLDDTPPVYAPGTPRLLSVGERGVTFVATLNEPGRLRYVLQPSVASPPTLDAVLNGENSTQVELPVGSTAVTEYVLDGIQGDSSYALYIAASDLATPTPNTKARLEVLLFTTKLCDPCPAGRRLPLAADCACAVGSPFQVRVGVLADDFDARRFVRALAAYLRLLPSQVLVTSVTTYGDPALVGDEYLSGDEIKLANLTNVTAFSDKTLVAFELLPLRPPWFLDLENVQLTSGVVNSTLVPSDQPSPWPGTFGGVWLISAPTLPGPPTTFIDEQSLPLGRVFPRYQAANPLLDLDGWVRPSVPAEAIGKRPNARFVFGATLGGGAVRGPCATCRFLCRLDVTRWEPCTSPYVVTGLTVGEHLLQVRAITANGTMDPLAAFYTWAIDLGPWVGFVARPPAAVNTSLLPFAFASAAGCSLTYSLNNATSLPIAGVGSMSTPVLFTLPGTTSEGRNSLEVACTMADNTTVTAKHSWKLDTAAPAITLLSGELASGAVIHRDTATWLLEVNDTDALSGPGSGVADVQCRMVDSTNATSPAPLFDWTPCPAALQGSVNATGLLALASGSYALQLFATDHAGSACSVVAFSFVVDTSLPLTPTAAVVGFVVTLAPAGTGATTAFYKITNVVNGLLFISTSNATVAAGTFVAKADAAAGLRFVPTPTFFSGDALGSTFGFDVQAADALKRLGGDVLHVSLTVPHINSAPVVDASQPLFMRDAYNTGAALYNTLLGQLVADLLATGVVTDADDGDTLGMAVISAASPLGAWEASADGGASWFALAAASPAWPILVGGGAFDRLRFMPQLDHVGVLSTTDWAATASLAFYAWDGSDGSVAGASCKLVSVDAPEASAAAARNSSLFDLLVELQSAANGSTVCIPFDTTYDSAGPFSADAAVAVIRVFDVGSARITDADAQAARSAAAAYADAVAGCPPKHPSAVDLPVSQTGAALMLTSGGAPLPAMAPPWTVEAWVRKRARLSSTVLMASSSYPAATSVALLLECSGAAFTIGVRRVGGWPGGAADLSFGVEAPLDTWTHLAFVDDGQVLALYVNGTLASAPLALGGMPLPSGSVGYNRSVSAFAVDELRIWTVARSARQVAAAVQAQLPSLGVSTLPSDGLLYSLRFEEGCGANATDTASRNLTAVLAGGASFVRGVSLASVDVAGVFPEEGPPGGGGVLTLLGSGFPAAPSADAVCVFSNGLVSPAATAANATAVTCVVPPALGDGAVLVSYADPGRGCFAPAGVAYTYASAFVAAIHPSQGPAAGGTLVTLSGSGFHAAPGAAQCRFACALSGGVAPTAEAWLVSASLLQCETPTQAHASACFVEVSLNGGADWLPHPQLFTFVSALLAAPLPQANATFAARHGSAELLQTGPTSGGGRLQLLLPPLDSGPLSRAALPACGIGTLRPLAARMSGANSIECASPARVRGAAPVSVSVNGRDWEQLGGVFGPRRFVTHSPPTAEAVLPEEAPAVGGTLLTVFGFGGAAAWDLSCAFGSSSADGVAPADARSSRGLGIQVGQGVQCVSPSVAPGFVAIRLAGDGVTGRHDGGVLQFLAREAPLTSNAFPRVLDAGGGTLLAVSGSHFAPSMLCAFANGTTAPVHFVSTALVQCEAPPGAPGLNTVAVLPALHEAAPPDDQDSGAVRVAYAAGIADPAAAADGVPLGILCAFRTVRIAASAGPDGAVDCRLPAGFVESVPAGLGNNWQDVAYGSSDDNSTSWNATDGFNLTSTPGRLDELAAFPGAGSAAGFTQLSVFAAAAAQLPSAQLSCQFLEAGRVTTALAVAGACVVPPALAVAGACVVPPALSSLGGFAVVRLVMSASGATLDVAETQFLYAPAARVTNVALPRVTALATDSRGRVHPGRLLWSGRPVTVAGAHFAGEAAIACRFGGEIRPASWVSTALVRCELTDTAAVDPASPVAVAERAADDASWSAAASCAVFSWLR